MQLTAGQACFLYGWLSAKYTLTWNDVLRQDNITFRKLQQANLTLEQIYQIQPDLQAWIRHRKVDKSDVPSVVLKWDCDVVRDFQYDLGDIINAKWSADKMHQLGLSYQGLCDIGLTSENMVLFKHVTLTGWGKLGLSRRFAQDFPEPHLYACFGMKKNDVLAALV